MILRWLLVSCLSFWLLCGQASASLYREVDLVDGQAQIPESQEVFKVSGSAWFVPGELLKPRAMAAAEHQRLISFPEAWRKLSDPMIPAHGVGTYRLLLQLPATAVGQSWGFWLPRSLGPMRVWINGQLIAEKGHVAAEARSIRYEGGNVRLYFVASRPVVELIVQTANFHLHSGGFAAQFFIGREQAMRRFTFALNMVDGGIAGALAFSALYNLCLYTFRRKWRLYLILGVFFSAMTVRISLLGMSRWGLDFGWPEIFTWKLQYVSFYVMIPLGLVALSWAFPAESSNRLGRWVNTITLLSILWVAVTPQWLSYYSLRPMQLLVFPTIGIFVWTLVRAVRHKRPGARQISLGILALSAAGIPDILDSLRIIETTFSSLGPALLMFAVISSFFQATFFEKIYLQVEHQIDAITGLKSELEEQAQRLEERVQRKTEDLEAVLANTEESIVILTSGPKGVDVSPLASHAAYRLFQASPLRWDAVESFLRSSQLTADQYAQWQAALIACMGGTMLDFELNESCFPVELRLMDGQAIRWILSCRWIPLLDGDIIREMLLVLFDVTSERREAQRLLLTRAATDRLLQIAALEPKNFLTFMHEASELLRRARLASMGAGEQSQNIILRELHTLKGLARSFGLLHLASELHEAEGQIMGGEQQGADTGAIGQILDTLTQSLRTYEKEAVAAGYIRAQQFEFSSELLSEIYAMAQLLQRTAAAVPPRWFDLWQIFLFDQFRTPQELLRTLEKGLIHLSRDLQKPLPEIRREGPKLFMTPKYFEGLLSALTHMFRNAVDHGIEEPQERQAAGKPVRGCITVTWSVSPYFQWQIADDGQGLHLARILQRATEKGLVRPGDSLRDDTIAELVFAPGFSTKGQVTTISGRGMGMDAVRGILAEMGGSIRVMWLGDRRPDGRRSCVWVIVLPRALALEEAA